MNSDIARAAPALCFLFSSVAGLHAQAVDVIFAVEMSQGTEQAIGLLNQRALRPGDRAGFIGMNSRSTQRLLSLTGDREALSSALQKAGRRVGVGFGGVQVSSSWAVDLVTAISRACEELKRNSTSEKRAVVLLFGSEDPRLRTELPVLESLVDSDKIRLYAVAIDRSAYEQARRQAFPVPAPDPFPASTAQSVAELCKHTGGRMFRGAWSLKDILKEMRQP